MTPNFSVDTNPLVVTGVNSYAEFQLDASNVPSSGTEGIFKFYTLVSFDNSS